MEASLSATPYERLGGAPAVLRLVDRLYRWMERLPEAAAIHAMHHRSDMAEVKARVAAFLTGLLGGPDVYRPAYGEPRMCRRHAPFAIGPAERDTWMLCLDHALDEVVEDPALREEVRRAVGAMAETGHRPLRGRADRPAGHRACPGGPGQGARPRARAMWGENEDGRRVHAAAGAADDEEAGGHGGPR